MGEWSEYFEDFPEENPGNYDRNGRFNPQGAAAERAAESKLRQDQANLNAEIRAIVEKHRPSAANKK